MIKAAEVRGDPNDRLATTLVWARALLSLVMSPLGALLAILSLGIHERASGYRWGSRRYAMEHGGWTWQIVDFFLSLLLGGIILPRLTWLGIGGIARLLGRRLPLSGFVWWLDLFSLIIPGTLLAYLVYSANR